MGVKERGHKEDTVWHCGILEDSMLKRVKMDWVAPLLKQELQ